MAQALIQIVIPFAAMFAIMYFLLKWCKLEKVTPNRELKLSFKGKVVFDKRINSPEVFKLTLNDGNEIVKLVNRNWKVVPIQELTINNCNTTIFKSEQETFTICNIWKCYVDICKSLLKSDLTKCRKDNIDSSSLLFNRDVIWMTINVLTYYINRNQLFEAQRILEEVNGCNGFCNKSYSMLKSGGCGCGR